MIHVPVQCNENCTAVNDTDLYFKGYEGLEGPVGPQGYPGCNGTKVCNNVIMYRNRQNVLYCVQLPLNRNDVE
jgi:hypothetical protein